MEYVVNAIVAIILLAIAGAIIRYLYRAKKRGETCIGCPYAKECKGKCGCGCSCGTEKVGSRDSEK